MTPRTANRVKHERTAIIKRQSLFKQSVYIQEEREAQYHRKIFEPKDWRRAWDSYTRDLLREQYEKLMLPPAMPWDKIA